MKVRRGDDTAAVCVKAEQYARDTLMAADRPGSHYRGGSHFGASILGVCMFMLFLVPWQDSGFQHPKPLLMGI